MPRFPIDLLPWQARLLADVPAFERAWRDCFRSGVYVGAVGVSIAWLAAIVFAAIVVGAVRWTARR